MLFVDSYFHHFQAFLYSWLKGSNQKLSKQKTGHLEGNLLGAGAFYLFQTPLGSRTVSEPQQGSEE